MHNGRETCFLASKIIGKLMFLLICFGCNNVDDADSINYLNKDVTKDYPFKIGSRWDYSSDLTNRANLVGLGNLSGGYDSFQVRIWIIENHLEWSKNNLIVLKNNRLGWQGINYKFECGYNKKEYLIAKDVRKEKIEPKSWPVLVRGIIDNNILTLPDYSTLKSEQYRPTHSQANLVIIEYADTALYRFYALYRPNETISELDVAKNFEDIIKILIKQFGLNDLKKILPMK